MALLGLINEDGRIWIHDKFQYFSKFLIGRNEFIIDMIEDWNECLLWQSFLGLWFFCQWFLSAFIIFHIVETNNPLYFFKNAAPKLVSGSQSVSCVLRSVYKIYWWNLRLNERWNVGLLPRERTCMSWRPRMAS